MLAATKFTLNTSMIAITDLLIKSFSYLFILFLARNISVNDFGLYSFIVSFFYFFWVISDFGLQYLTARNVAEEEFGTIQNSAVTRFIMASFAFVLCLVAIMVLGLPGYNKVLIGVYSLSLFSIAISESILPIFRGMENFFYERLVLLCKNIVFILTAIISIYLTQNLLFLALAYLFSEVTGALISYYLLKSLRLDLKINWLKFNKFSFGLLRQSFPLVAGISLLIIYYKIDGVMLKFLQGNYELGIYSSAFRIFEALLFIPAAIHVTILPRLIKMEKQNLKEAIDKVVKIVLITASVISILVIGYSSYIPLLYGKSDYQALVDPLRVIFLVAPVAFLNYIYIAIAYVEKREAKVIFPLLVTMLINIGANYYFIPKYSYMAAAWTTNLSEIILLITISMLALPKAVSNNRLIAKNTLAYGLSLSTFLVFGYSPVLPLLVLAVYFVFVRILRIFNGDDLNVARKIFLELTGVKNYKGLIKN